MTDCPCQQCQNSTENGTVVTDLLTRLEKLCQGHTHSVSMPCPIAQAADEIKRLRHQLERERTILAHIKESRIFWIDMARRYAAVLRDG